MCLGVPGRVERVWDDEGIPMAEVDFGGVRKEVCLAYVPEVEVDDWTIVHVGFALPFLQALGLLIEHLLDARRQLVHGANDLLELQGARLRNGNKAPFANGLSLVDHIVQWLENAF